MSASNETSAHSTNKNVPAAFSGCWKFYFSNANNIEHVTDKLKSVGVN